MLFCYSYSEYLNQKSVNMHEYHCECGWEKGYETSNGYTKITKCPVCGVELYQDDAGNNFPIRINSEITNEPFHFQHTISSAPKAFEVEMYRFLVSRNKNKPMGEQITQIMEHKYRINLNLEPQFNIELFDKNSSMTPTLSNIRKAMAHVSFHGALKNSIFYMLWSYAKCSASEVICLFKKNPVLEKIYSLDPEMRSFVSYRDCLDMIDQTQAEPHRVFGLNKLLYKLYIEIAKQIKFPLSELYNMVLAFGEQQTEQILQHCIKIIETERACNGYQERTAFKLYYSLLSRDDMAYDPKALMEYVTDRIYTYQGIEKPSEGLSLLNDYLDICNKMKVTPEKYPRSLKLVHDIAVKNHKIFLDECQRQKFKEIVEKKDYQALKYQDKEYCVIAPTEPDDLIHEGAALSHCVGSYISKVINSGIKILFMRKTKEPDKSLITLDVRDNALFFSAGFDNRVPTSEEQAFITKWLKAKKISGSGSAIA